MLVATSLVCHLTLSEFNSQRWFHHIKRDRCYYLFCRRSFWELNVGTLSHPKDHPRTTLQPHNLILSISNLPRVLNRNIFARHFQIPMALWIVVDSALRRMAAICYFMWWLLWKVYLKVQHILKNACCRCPLQILISISNQDGINSPDGRYISHQSKCLGLTSHTTTNS